MFTFRPHVTLAEAIANGATLNICANSSDPKHYNLMELSQPLKQVKENDDLRKRF